MNDIYVGHGNRIDDEPMPVKHQTMKLRYGKGTGAFDIQIVRWVLTSGEVLVETLAHFEKCGCGEMTLGLRIDSVVSIDGVPFTTTKD